MKQKFNIGSLKTFVAAIAVAGTAMTPLSAVQAAADGWGHGEGVRHVGSRCSIRDTPGCRPFENDFRGHYPKNFKKHRGGYYPRHVERRHHDDGNAAAIILGITGAAIIAGALANSNPPTVYETYPAPDAYPPAPSRGGPKVITYGSTLEPWTRGWYEWCDDHYRSFNPETGTYRGYDNRDHFCVPK